MPQLLVEFFSEEIPARMQVKALQDLRHLFVQGLEQYGLTWSFLETYVTPHRLVLVAEDVPALQAEITEEKRGPRVDAPASALEGFLASVGLPLEACEQRTTPKGTFYFANVIKPARSTLTVLPQLIEWVIRSFPWPKSMRWGSGHTPWIRPLQSILCLFDGAPVDLELTIPSVTATQGHRFMAPHTVMADNFSAYKEGLARAHVIVDHVERRKMIEEALLQHARHHYLTLVEDQKLLDEVTGLVEWPVVLLGKIEEKFMNLPEEVLTTVMRNHQRYFALKNPQGELAPYFMTVANISSRDGGTCAVRGNEWVLRARLADAKFFWQEDLKTPLQQHGDKLQRLVFHARLGSMEDKVSRLTELALNLGQSLFPALDPELIRHAASLCKADLTTQMVGEFPELQGMIGAHLAIAQGLNGLVATAIKEHYAPQGLEHTVPTQPLSIVLSLADKLDTLAGFFLIAEKPSGSKDPYALRRAALGVLRLVLDNELATFSLTHALLTAQAGYRNLVDNITVDKALKDLQQFFSERLKVYLRDRGVRHDVVDACLWQVDRPYVVLYKAIRLQDFLKENDAQKLTQAYKRACNILRIEQEKDKRSYDIPFKPDALVNAEEKALAESLEKLHAPLQEEAAKALPDLTRVFTLLTAIGPMLDAFFDKITVNAPEAELRTNRLALLAHLKNLFEGMFIFSHLEG